MQKIDWRKTTKFRGPEESPGFLLWKVSMRWRRLIENALIECGLTHPQFVLLASTGWLTKSGAKLSQIDLAAHCEIDVSMTSQVLRTLEKKGLIKRKQHPEDARSKHVILTVRGADLIKKALPIVEGEDESFFHNLSSNKMASLLRGLQGLGL